MFAIITIQKKYKFNNARSIKKIKFAKKLPQIKKYLITNSYQNLSTLSPNPSKNNYSL